MEQKPAINILVTGANGQLGMEFRALQNNPAYNINFTTHDQLPLENEQQVKIFFSDHLIDYCINCGAYTNVDGAESNQGMALAVNRDAVGFLASVCKEYKTKLIHISTDYVFPGDANKPYSESDPTHPVNSYGISKLSGENAAIQNNPGTLIIRTSWLYSSFGKNFVKTMLRLMSEKDVIGVVNDQHGSPTYAADLAHAIMHIISNNFIPGIYNYCNKGIITWFEFAQEIKILSGATCIINPITTSQFPTPAKRPEYSALNTHKIEETFHLHIRSWKDALAECNRLLSA